MIQIEDSFLDKTILYEIIENCGGYLFDRCYFAKECYRSGNLIHIYDDIKSKIESAFGINITRMSLFKHPVENFPEVVSNPPQHTDWSSERSGVIYLIGERGMGTTVDNEYIEFEVNRAICFDGHTPHNPNFGGKDRIVLTFFGNKS